MPKKQKKYTIIDDDNDNDNNEELDMVAFRNFVADMFPSKYSKQKARATCRLQKHLDESNHVLDDDDDSANYETVSDSDSDSDSESLYDTESDSESSEGEKENNCRKRKRNGVNVFFTVHDVEKHLRKNNYVVTTKKEEKEHIDTSSNVLQTLELLKGNNDGSPLMKEFIDHCEQRLANEKKIESQRHKSLTKIHLKTFQKLNEDKTLHDKSYFKKLNIDQQKKVNDHVTEINTIMQPQKPYRFMVIESDIPITFKAAALSKINAIEHMDPDSSEYYKVKSWIDGFMKIPFNVVNELPITVESGVDQCHEFMLTAKKTLDNAVYGLNDAKMQIMQMLGQFITNPKSIGTSIAIHGPPGTGKTSLVKEGISKILHRPFAFIALGGATDSNVLEGHSYTYVGSTWGKIVQILIDSKCMNPIIYFDELDKISDTPRGEEIIGILTHLTDTTQNSHFHDKFFAEFSFDLSKCLFIFSYNDEKKINPVLRDRMYRIQTDGYSNRQKNVIVQQYLLPKIREQVKFNEGDIVINDDIVSYILEKTGLCENEKGVRNLKRCLEIIHTKLNLFRLMKTDENIFEEDMSSFPKFEFPIVITKSMVDKLLKNNKENISALYSMYS